GAKPAAGPRGPASAGETFTGELTVFLADFNVPRPAAIEVDDPVVSTVRLFPETGGTIVSIFVRQPVTYSISRPSAIGEITFDLDDESGWVEAGTAELKPSNYTLTGERIEKRGGPLYAASHGVFTTCRCGGLEKPSWSIGGASTDITLEGTGVVRHATFRVKD